MRNIKVRISRTGESIIIKIPRTAVLLNLPFSFHQVSKRKSWYFLFIATVVMDWLLLSQQDLSYLEELQRER